MSGSAIINTSIQNNDFDEKAFLEMLGDERIRKIYQIIAEQPRTASEIKHITNFPNTTSYRHLTWLLQNGLVRGMHRGPGEVSKILFYPIIKNAIIEFSPSQIKIIKKMEVEQ